jgi:hypothetical protein
MSATQITNSSLPEDVQVHCGTSTPTKTAVSTSAIAVGSSADDESNEPMDGRSPPTSIEASSNVSSDDDDDADALMEVEDMLEYEEHREYRRLYRYMDSVEYEYDGKLLLVANADGTRQLYAPNVELKSHFWRGYDGLPISLYSDDGRVRDKRPGFADLDYRVPNEHFRYVVPFDRDMGYEDAFLADIHRQLIEVLKKAGWQPVDIEEFMYFRFPAIVDKKITDGPCGRPGCVTGRCTHDEQFLQFHWSSRREVPDLRRVPLYFKKTKLLFLGHGAMVEKGYASVVVLGLDQTADISALFDTLQRAVDDKGTLLEVWERQVVINGLSTSRRQLQIPIRLKAGVKLTSSPSFKLPLRFLDKTYHYYFEFPAYY